MTDQVIAPIAKCNSRDYDQQGLHSAGPANCFENVKVHSAASMFPMMSDAELDELAADIDEHNLRAPIVFAGAELVDGRNRLAAIDRIPDQQRRELLRNEAHQTPDSCLTAKIPTPT